MLSAAVVKCQDRLIEATMEGARVTRDQAWASQKIFDNFLALIDRIDKYKRPEHAAVPNDDDDSEPVCTRKRSSKHFLRRG